MQNNAKRVCIFILCMGTLCTILFGCSKKVHVDAESVDKETDSHVNQSITAQGEDGLDIQFSKVSLISNEGMDVELDVNLFQEKWLEYTPFLIESPPLALLDSYTIVGWDQLNQPHVIQVATDGIKLGQDYFQAERTLTDLVYWMREQMGIEYLNNLSMERIILEARDLEIKKELPFSLAEDVFDLIKTSTLVKGEPRIVSPLYPAYLIDVEYKKDQFLQLVVLSPTLLSIEDGQDRWFYQLNKSIFSLLKEVIPITYFSRQHIKHLFQAQEINIVKAEQKFSLSAETNEALTLEALIHQYVRYFAKGRKVSATNQEVDPLKYRVQFSFSDSSILEMEVGDHVYFYEGQRYELYNIGNKIEEIISVIELHNKQKK